MANKHADAGCFAADIPLRRDVDRSGPGMTGRRQSFGGGAGGRTGFHDGLRNVLGPGECPAGKDARPGSRHRMEAVRSGEMIVVQLDSHGLREGDGVRADLQSGGKNH